EDRGREGARHAAGQGAGGGRAAARAGAQGNRRREGKGPASAAAGGRGPLHLRRLEAARRDVRHRSEPPPGDGVPGGARAAPVKTTTIARNYAEALCLAGEAVGGDAVERYGRLLDVVAGAIQADERIAVALDSPRVAKATKSALLARALGGVAPPEFVRFLQAVVRRGRQGLFGEIAHEYQGLVDVKLNRVHAGVTLPREPDPGLEREIVDRLAAAFSRPLPASTVLPPVAKPHRHRASPHDPPDDLGGQLPGLEHRSREGGRQADRPRHPPRDRPTSRQRSVPAGTGAVVAILNR